MPVSKTIHFNQRQNQMAGIAKALAHPARIAILEVLMAQDTCVCHDIVDQLPLAQATVSQHLKVLKEAGLIQGTIDPRRSCYCIDPVGWTLARQLLGDWMAGYTSPEEPSCCE